MTVGKCFAVLLLAAAVLVTVAASRSFEYDEAYSVFVTSPTPRPAWPDRVFRVGEVRGLFHAHAGPVAIARALRKTDVHPPLYFWTLAAWRAAFGDGLLRMRLLSVLCALAALALVGRIARVCDLPWAPAMLFTLGSYGFAYTGAVARDFAMAQMLALAGVLLVLRAERRRTPSVAALAGLCLGAATLTSYLAAFVAAAAFGWLLATGWRRPKLWLAGGIGYAAALPAVLWFFLAQRNSRPGQFPSFHLAHAVAELVRYGAANLLGGLPLYVPVSLRAATIAALGSLAMALIAAVALRWRRIAAPKSRWLFLGGALAPAAGLLVLGALFDNTPIELRYLCFGVPFTALLLAGALDRWRAGRALALVLGGVQVVSLIGLAFSPTTMQPFRRIAAEAATRAGLRGVILAPLGNDGVGAVGPLIAELPGSARVRLVPQGTAAAVLRSLPAGTLAVKAGLDVDAASRATGAELDRTLRAGARTSAQGWIVDAR